MKMPKSAESKYVAIAESIAAQIRSGKITAGNRVTSENEIIAEWGVSNTTARKALSELEARGLVDRVKGKGTIALSGGKYITRAIGSFDAISSSSFSDNLRLDGFEPRVKIVESSFFNGRVSSEISKRFYEIVGRIYKIRILRFADSVLFKDETRYIDSSLCNGIEKLGDIDPVIRTLREKFSVAVESVERSFSARVSNCADEFKSRCPIALIELDGASLLKNGRPVEIEKSLYRADRYKFSVTSEH